MKEINIAKILVTKRREKGITQEELAAYIGVSKASVSKWETEQSYPDITFLPQLAAYFNISIDELMDYSPQMTREDIKKLYHQLAADFASKPFDEVLAECKSIIKKYYSCFPLLLQMAILLANHHMLAPETEQQQAILRETAEICNRVKVEGEDVWLSKDAVSMEATIYLLLQEPQGVLDLLGENIRPFPQDTGMIAQAYQMMGNIGKAKEASQISMYQHLLLLVCTATSYLMLNADQIEKVEETLTRIMGIANLYELEELHPNTMVQIYLTAAHVYCMNGNTEKALDMLQSYTEVCTLKFFPLTLHGDSYFDAIDGWFENFDLGTGAPRSGDVIRESMLQGVQSNPSFASLHESARYQSIVDRLQANIVGNHNL